MNSHDIKVVLPTAKDLEGHIITASDFALGAGVRFREFVYCEASDSLKCRIDWNPDQLNLNCAYVATSTAVTKKNKDGEIIFRMKAKFPYNDAQLNYVDNSSLNCFAGDHALGIVPKFVHPEAIGMSIEVDPRYYGLEMGILKIGDQIPTAPQSYAGSKMSKKLESLMKQGQLKQVGTFTIDGLATSASHLACQEDVNSNYPIDPLVCPRFTYQGVDYVRKEFVKAKTVGRMDKDGDFQLENGQFANGTVAKVGKPCWFKCEPYQAMKNRDGSITCLDAIFPCQTEVETEFESNARKSFLANPHAQEKIKSGATLEVNLRNEQLSGVKFLNEVFLPEMLQSVGLNLDKLNQAKHEM